jgi:hypothetical protein
MVKLKRMLLVLALCSSTASADTTFAPGSLIIPASSTYQTDCGAVAIYGLVFDILRANTWLEANRATVCPGFPADVTCQIELYYAYREAKASPNRCTPTNQHLGPAYTGSGTITHAHPKWNDGCDFEVGYANLAQAPVKQVAWATATDPSTDSIVSTINTSSKTAVYPRWASKTVNHTSVSTTDVDLVRYWGGSFIIDDADALTLRKLMKVGAGTINAKDVEGNTIDFSPFRQTTCSFGTTVGGGVNIHRAMVEFTAPTPRVLTATPPRIALLAQNSGTSTATKTGKISDGILQEYLERAGLTYLGAQGCPPGGFHANDPLVCPTGGTPGQIYDQFDFVDLTNNKLAATSNGKPIYRMFWAPHWDTQNSVAGKDVDQTTNEKLAMSNIAAFANGQNGVMTECASIETLEGQKRTTSNVTKGASLAQLQTCIPGNNGTCSASTTPYGLKTNSSATASTSDPTGTLFNCTDPGMTAEGGDCVYYGYAGDPFVQTADFRWVAATGRVADFIPNTATGSTYRPGVLPLISGVTALDSTKLTNPSAARAIITGDFVSRNYKDNDLKKSNVLYLGGHNLTNAVAGTKVVLQTLLLLGEPPPELKMKEVTRSTAIPFVLDGVGSMIQGTFEKWTPTKTAPILALDTDLTAFKFPHVLGHLRAIPVANIGTDQVDYAKVTPTFDVATKIPPAVYAGCGTNAFKGTCRTIFTNLVGGARPVRTLFQTANATAIGLTMASGIPLIAATQLALVNKVLDAKLGGVDRSTVAVIPASAVTNMTRPTMIYFGGLDGMMHAVCGSIVAGSACATAADVGRELWAFMPRTQLMRVRKNTTRIDGSPRVIEMFGDFGTGSRGVRTILLFQTGSGNATANVLDAPAVYALDITNPQDPTILWEYAGGATQPFEMGVGLTIAAGRVQVDGVTKLVAFAQTQNGGTGGTGVTVTAINIETGAMIWRWGSSYPAPRVATSGVVPSTGIPGGATVVDRSSTGFTTDVVFGTLYGDIWQLDATTGVSRQAPNPLFRFTADKKPFGAQPALMSSSGRLYAVAGSGGYADTSATILWSGTQHQVIAASTGVQANAAPLTQQSTPPDLAWVMNLAAGERVFSQATVIGTQLMVTADIDDVNQTTFGDSQSGRLYRVATSSGVAVTAAITIAGGSSSVIGYGNQMWVSGGKGAQQVGGNASTSGGEVVNTIPSPKVTRRLWLKTQ